MQVAESSGLPRSTYNDLQKTSRPPLPRIVHAFADALGIPRVEAEQLAGLRPMVGRFGIGVKQAIESDEILTDSNKRTMIELYEQLTEAHRARVSPTRRPTSIEDGQSDDERTAI